MEARFSGTDISTSIHYCLIGFVNAIQPVRVLARLVSWRNVNSNGLVTRVFGYNYRNVSFACVGIRCRGRHQCDPRTAEGLCCAGSPRSSLL